MDLWRASIALSYQSGDCKKEKVSEVHALPLDYCTVLGELCDGARYVRAGESYIYVL